jgi:hypothetical protein
MEENTKKQEEKKLSYEDLSKVAMQLQQRVINAEQKLQEINYVAMRLNYLFAVLKSKEVFPQEFITQCSNEVMELLKIETKEEEETKTEE